MFNRHRVHAVGNKISNGWLSGFIGVLIFSGSLPATKLAVTGFDPIFLTFARGAIAGILATAILLLIPQKRPSASDVRSLIVVAVGIIIGFPLLTALALREITSAYSIVFIGILPLATAVFGVIRGGERPRPAFWICSILGSLCVVGFALTQGSSSSLRADLLMIGAIIICGLGYAEGASLSRRLGGWQVICWTLVISLPVMLILALITMPEGLSGITLSAWSGLAYVSLFSMLIGFIFWYHGLAKGGIAAVGQLQLLQPFFGLCLAALLLGERISPAMIFASIAVVACVAGAKHFAK